MRQTISALLLFALLSVPRAYADPLANAVAALPADVVQMSRGGEWRADGASGTFRFLVARAAPGSQASRFFVQWIRANGSEAVVATAEVVEIGQTPQRLTDYRIDVGPEGTDVFVDTQQANGAIGEYMLLLHGPGRYEFSLLGN